MKTAKRLESATEYYFSSKLREVRRLAQEGRPIINLGIGSPDLLPGPEIVEAMRQDLHEHGVHQYQPYTGIPELRQAIAEFYEKRFGVTLDRDREILPLMGSKEGIMHLSMAYLDPGDRVWVPDPGYPTYRSVSGLMQARAEGYRLDQGNGYLPDLDQLRNRQPGTVKLMWINYPHMPTGARASARQLEEIVDFCREYEILLVNDNPYAFVLNEEPLSLLSVPGAREVAVELNSLSKTFNLAGWRIGMLLGSPEVLQSTLKVKSNMDSGMFRALQVGAVRALQSNEAWFAALNRVYTTRRMKIWELCEVLGLSYDPRAAGMFVWARLPEGVANSTVFTDRLLYEFDLFAAPGTVFGDAGEGYVRFSLCVPSEQIDEAIGRFKTNV